MEKTMLKGTRDGSTVIIQQQTPLQKIRSNIPKKGYPSYSQLEMCVFFLYGQIVQLTSSTSWNDLFSLGMANIYGTEEGTAKVGRVSSMSDYQSNDREISWNYS